MLKYEYENATVYITEPTEKHLKIIREATEKFMQRVVKEQIRNESRGHNRRTNNDNSRTRQRVKRSKK